MSAPSAPNLVDYLTLFTAVVGSIGGIFTTVWATRRSDQERLNLLIDWTWQPHTPDGEWPVLHVHNKGTAKVLIGEIRFLTGVVRPKSKFGTAVYWEDPSDLPFPAEVAASGISRFRLDENAAKKHFRKAKSWQRAFGLIGRSYLWLEVVTAGGTRKRVAAERALPWADRPSWTKVRDEDEA